MVKKFSHRDNIFVTEYFHLQVQKPRTRQIFNQAPHAQAGKLSNVK